MAKQLNVNLAFTADTGKAKAQIQDLQRSLDTLITGVGKSGELGLTKDLVEARGAAADLKVALQGALTPTGSIDLSKFDDGLKRSGKTLEDYRIKLDKLGPQGQETFLKLSQSIISAEAPLKRTNKLLDEFKTTMENTVRWQLSSSLLHGFMGSLQSAYGYAQDLNASLNDIRIVSGLSSDQMAKFAEEANKSARALSATTTAYTNAALIFYQQGLSDNAVKERTDAVIKMSNVTKDSEDEVSSYMTAIWNNFEGEKANLESYADVIAALGAATASSSAEIAGGLEKFAAIGQQIGLSYDYATTALATVVANTRQSEEVVGTAFKTIFARIQGLNLGETLDDGTTLNKYSQALKAVGIDIKDATGQLKDMDVILDEMGSKWQVLGKDQQVALAQTVAGTRQYNQLIALMDSWSTDFQKNLDVARNSSGALQEQADIYAESWEAARDRVRAASEAIYADLLDDDFFISILNGFEKILVGVDGVIDAMGGLRGILPGIVLLLNKMYGESIAKNIDNMIFNIERNTEAFKKQQEAMRQTAYEQMLQVNANSGTEQGDAKIHSLKIQTELQKTLHSMADNLSQQDIEELQHRLDIVDTYRKQVEIMAQLKDEKSDNLQSSREGMVNTARRNGGSTKAARGGLRNIQEMESAATRAKKELESLDKEFGSGGSHVKEYSDGLRKIKDDLIKAGFKKNSTTIMTLNRALEVGSKSSTDFAKAIKELVKNGEFADRTFNDIDEVAGSLGQKFGWSTKELDDFRQKVAELTQAGMDMDQAIDNAGQAVEEFKKKAEAAKSAAEAMGTTGQTIVRAFSGISQVSMAISSLASAFEVLGNQDMTPFEKFKSISTSLLMAIPSLIMGINALTAENAKLALAITAENAIESKNLIVKGATIVANKAQALSEKLKSTAVWGTVAAKIADLAVSAPLLAITLLLVAAIAALAAIIGVVVGVAKALSDAYNADAIAAEKAAAAATGLAEAFDEAKAHYEDMVAAMERYQTARAALDELTEGTTEYKEALKKANEEALSLINKTSSLKRGEDYNWENGQLIIHDEAMDRVKKEESERVSMAEASALMADARARQLSAKSNTTNLVRSDDVNGWAAVGAGAGTGAAIGGGLALGGVVTAVTAPVAAAIGGLIGGIVGGVTAGATNAADNAEEEERVQELTDLYRTMGEEAFDAAKLEELGFDTANQAYISSIKDIVKETIAAEEQLSNAARMAADITMSENASYSASENQDKIATVGGRMQEELYQEAYDKYFKQTQNDDIFGVGSKENKEAMQAYAQQMGLDQLNGYKVTNFKKGGNVEYEYIDEEGKKQTKEVTREQIAMQLAATEAAEKLGAETDRLVQAFNKLETSSNKADQALSDFLGGDMENSNQAEFEDIAKELGVNVGDEITTDQAGTYLNSKFGGDDGSLSDEEAKSYGYESAQAMKEAFVQEFNETSGAWESIEIPSGLNEKIIEGLSLGASKKIQSTYESLGKEGGEAFVNALNSFDTSALTDEQVSAMSEELANVDWSSWDAGEQAVEIAKRYGAAINVADEEWQQYIATMRDASNALPDLQAMADELQRISEISKDIDLGSIISQEDYETLTKYNSALKEYFTILSDGSAQFIGDKLDFQQKVNDTKRKELEDATKAYGDRARELETQLEAGAKAVGGRDNLDQYRDTEDYVGTDGKHYYDGANVRKQLDFLESQGYDQAKIDAWRTDISDGGSTVEEMQKIADAVNETAIAYNGLESEYASAQAAAQGLMNELALGAEDAIEREKLLEEGTINIDAFNNAAMAAHNAEKWEDIDPKEVDDYAESLMNAAESSEILSDELKNNEEAAEDVALYTKKMNKGIESLSESFEGWSDVLQNSDSSSQEYSEAMQGMKSAMSDVLGVSEEFLSNDYILENMEDIKLAAEGDAEAIDRLAIAAGKDIIMHLELEDESIREDLLTLHGELASEIPDIKVGTQLDDGDFLAKAQEIVATAGMTAEEANAYFRSMGFEAKFKTEEKDVEQRVPKTYTKQEITDVGFDKETGAPYWTTATSSWQDGYDTFTGKMDAIAMSTDGTTPIIESITKTNSGSMNNKSSSNPGTPPGGSKPKEAKKPNKKKAEEPEIDKYRTITEQLEKLNKELDNIGKAKDRAFGPAKLKLMQQEIDKQDEIIKKNKEYLKMLEQDRNEKRSKLESLGAEFDEKGTITNYEELIKKNQPDYTKYNEGIEYYRGLTGQQQEDLDKEYQGKMDADGNYYSSYEDYLNKTYGETAEKSHEEFMNLLDEYAEVDSKYSDKVQENIEAEWRKFDIKLEGIEYIIDVKLDVDDRDLRYLEFLLEQIEDKDFNAAEAIANIGLQIDNTLGKIETYKKGINDILSEVGNGYSIDDLMNGSVTLEQLQEQGLSEDGLAKLEGYIDGLAEENANLRAMRENAWAQVSEEFNEYIDNMDTGIEKIEHLKSITENYKNIVDIVGKKFLGVSNDLMDKMHESTVQQSKDLLAANKAKLEAIQASYDELKNQDTTGWSDQALKEREALLKEMEGQLQGAKEAFMSSWEEALQASADRYAAAVDNIIAEFEDSIAGLYGTLDELQEAYDRAKDLNSQYVEDYEQIYNLTKLTREINEAMDNTDNLEAKAAYRDYLEEINAELESGKQLSEYDIEYRQKKLELIQAEMALNEAKTAKSSVSMVRGEDGNYSYMYTASDEDVANAEQNYEDKLFEMQQLNGEYINNLQEQIIQTQAECAQALAAIKESDFNSYEEWRAAVDRTQAYYDQKMDFYYSQLDGTLSNNRNLYENDWTRYSEATGYKISADENYVDRFNETTYSILTGFQDRESAQAAWNASTDIMLTELAGAYSAWQLEVEGIMSEARTSVEGFADTMEEQTDRNVDDSNKAKEAVQEMAEQMQQDFTDTIGKITEWENTWGTKVDAAIRKNNELIASYNALKAAMAGALDTGEDNPDDGNNDNSDDNKNPDGPGGGDPGDGGGGTPNNGDKAAGVAAAIWMDGGPGSGWGNDPTRSKRLAEKGVTGAQAYLSAHGPNGDIYREWSKKRDQLKNFHYGSFDTGGYTGDWGDKSGRLALLHSKEIVLNAEDTKNFLSAIELVREIANIIDLNAAAASGAFGALSSATSVHGGEREIVQQIEIHAEFPDANNHNEIELAFNNLLNTASQYANRNR